ncbi:DUF1223 domain-containing protein [Palleronia sp.]|uniref:DUF1223 domain-containing protein n=1 Tax=Palleronia sp. TaxID=1940284 RepID=UPI0035C8374F
MRHALRSAVLALAVASPGVAIAEDQPVVVELFTSQGCASCPPADRLLGQLAGKPGVIALALHVDYWDYIGWPDAFADPRFTQRQKSYAKRSGERMIYTPQLVVGGLDQIVGSRVMEIADAISAHDDQVQPVRVEAERRGDKVHITARMADGAKAQDVLVQLVPYDPLQRVAIQGGENAGAVLDYVNIVRDWRVLGEWDGQGVWTGDAPLEGPAAVIVQEPGPGRILGAARVE